ncbi:bifunctional 5,10-methylenetetrahydrofolate dehydrogenase/5,10-methenyltetrahydrofolate cyclohydrolase [Microlunatus ginsengisoli]|uniref:Bifunctional protein FolD n=1 Tax=Microlunatus ginsengisoli TaxID=363863 RepID=A0ABP7AXC3_9ACTN
MTATPLPGGRLAAEIKAQVAALAEDWRRSGRQAVLAVVVATADESTLWYVRSLVAAADKTGIDCRLVDLGATATEPEIARHLDDLSADPQVHGILLQTPLPPGIAAARLVERIVPSKDVDGANPSSLGRLLVGQQAFAPATARAVVELLDYHQIPLAGRHMAVVGRSAVVGKPLLHLLLHRDATVTICHSASKPLARFTRPADIVAVAVGRPGLITADHIAPDTVVVDVGTNVAEDGRLVGDVDPDTVAPVAAGLTPVPGGVGSVTTALLLLHTLDAARASFARDAVAIS